MPHYYRHAIRSKPGEPGEIFLKGHETTTYADTVSSEGAVLDQYEGHEHEEHDAATPPRVSYAQFSPPRSRDEVTSVLLQAHGQRRPLVAPTRRLDDCAKDGLERDFTASSGTVAAIIIAAEIQLRSHEELKGDLLSVPALEEFTTVLTARRALSTIFGCLQVAKDIGFLRERDVDPQTDRFSGSPRAWKESRINLVDFTALNEVVDRRHDASTAGDAGEPSGTRRRKKAWVFSERNVDAWLDKGRPVLARVAPTELGIDLDFNPKSKKFDPQHAVVITGKDGDYYVVRTGWKAEPIARMKVTSPTEGWGLLFDRDFGKYRG
jgi:hypothetical protein